MTSTNELSWRIYIDGDRVIVGPREWNSCTSITYGIACFYIDEISKADYTKLLRRAAVTPTARCLELKTTYWTDYRFESACDDGRFGARW